MNTQRRLTPARRLRLMYEQLVETYGPQHWWPANSPFEVVLGAYLTQNTAWKAVERSLANLESARALSVEGIRSLPLHELQELIRPSGFYLRKAPALKAFVAMLDAEFGGSLEKLRSAPTDLLRRRLLDLPGVGLETADAILLYALGHPVPVGDEYLRRIVERHQLVVPAPRHDRKGYGVLVQLTRETFSADSAASLPRHFNEFHALIVAVGKAHCGREAKCDGCPLAFDLPTSGRRSS